MLEMQKFVLQRVQEDCRLFKKELLKSFQWLNNIELEDLRSWAINEFGFSHKAIIDEVFLLARV